MQALRPGLQGGPVDNPRGSSDGDGPEAAGDSATGGDLTAVGVGGSGRGGGGGGGGVTGPLDGQSLALLLHSLAQLEYLPPAWWVDEYLQVGDGVAAGGSGRI
jgi:hypothetical protein